MYRDGGARCGFISHAISGCNFVHMYRANGVVPDAYKIPVTRRLNIVSDHAVSIDRVFILTSTKNERDYKAYKRNR